MNDTRNRRVLIIDDNRAIHDDFHKILGGQKQADKSINAVEDSLFGGAEESPLAEPFETDSAFQGQEGLELVRQARQAGRPYAMAFIDVRMPPGWDGVQTTAEIWGIDSEVQVVICTAYSDYSWGDMMKKLGKSDRLVVLKKPFDIIEVAQLAETLTTKWQLTQNARRKMQDLEEAVQQRTFQLTKANKALRAENDERAIVEQALRESESRYKELVNAQGEGVIVTDVEQRLRFANPAAVELLGVPAEDLFGRRLEEFVALKDRETLVKQIEPSKGHSKSCCELELATPGGQSRHVLLTATSRFDSNRQFCGTLAICRDVTAWKKAERDRQMMEVQLRQAQKLEAIGQLAAGIAHEINTPTQYVGDNIRFIEESWASLAKVLRSYQELIGFLKENQLRPEMTVAAEELLAAADLEYLYEQIPGAIKASLEGVGRVSKIVRAMKEFSHPGGKDKTTADLNKAIESTATVARNEWKYVADLKLDLDPDLPVVPCFLGEFNQSILNLIINAAHAIGDVVREQPGSKGEIVVQTRRNGAFAEIRVSDTGTGIPESVRPHIFEPFFTTKGVGKGSGQGLPIVYGSIVKEHGGSVTFETEVGKGTSFILKLPLAGASGDKGFVTEFTKAAM